MLIGQAWSLVARGLAEGSRPHLEPDQVSGRLDGGRLGLGRVERRLRRIQWLRLRFKLGRLQGEALLTSPQLRRLSLTDDMDLAAVVGRNVIAGFDAQNGDRGD